MLIECAWKAAKAKKLESKKTSWTGYLQTVTIMQPTGPLKFDMLFADGEKLFNDTNEKTVFGKVKLASSDRGDLRILPASAGVLMPNDIMNQRISSGDIILVNVQAWKPEYRAAGSYEDRTWEDSYTQALTVLDSDLWPTDMTVRTYNDFETDTLPTGVYHAELRLTSRKHLDRLYPSFKLFDVTPVNAPVAQSEIQAIAS